LPVRFSRLRIAGFKSFAEPVSLDILPGLTGIVGPNGCGKSNVVEALRWAMGENSARSLRGGEMQDVIFSGTAARPSRNIAEVTLALDETQGAAPPPFHEQPELEISRKIERGAGSTYRVNGREVRARDVQTLFADLASGAHSSAMVSQGRVGAIVNARPEQRRAILEEAAGITGLHARRHEAELKLKAAEANMARAEDLRGQLEAQLAGLKRQARQASRWRNISGAIRNAECELFAIQRARADATRAAAQAALHDAEMDVAAATEAATAATAQATDAAAALPPLRETEGDARTERERRKLASEQLAAEQARAEQALATLRQRIAEIARDLDHADRLGAEATASGERLAAETATLEASSAQHPALAEQATAEAAEAADAVRAADAEANRATDEAAAANAAHQAATAEHAQAEQRHRRVFGQRAHVEAARDQLAGEAVPAERIEAADSELAAAESALAESRAGLETAESARHDTHAALASARERESAADSAHARLRAESQALAEVLAVHDGEQWPPMVDALSVPAGLEAALGAVLGEELNSAADPNAARHWRELPPLDPVPALPDGVTALAEHVQGPAALSRALSQIGLVDGDAQAEATHASLRPGQSLVSREGGVWRWDGYTIRPGTPTAAAIRLQQRNRLAALRERLAEAEADTAAARAAREAAQLAERAAVDAERDARTAARTAEQRLERARRDAAQLRSQAAQIAARLAATEEQAARLAAECAEAQAALDAAAARRAGLPDLAALRAAVEAARSSLSAARGTETTAKGRVDALAREAAARAARLTSLAEERAACQLRATDAAQRGAELRRRQAEASAEQDTLAAAPAEIAARRAAAVEELDAADSAHRHAADRLTAAETVANETSRTARAAEATLHAAREAAIRAQAGAEAADHAWGVVAERILEKLGAAPGLPDPPAELSNETEERARRKLERLLKERDEMGPVNLRAEIEADEVDKQIASIVHEREELTAAIAKLRGSIGHLNREGRERLGAVFADIDRHFQALFTRMFNGGRAHLALVGSDDPLEAGLEIFAQPPGKKLATLSLLSGGEQALTALSLIFAVFRCNPAPVCVLDEVDAPLDDANVERFCSLLDDMVRETHTRFMVVTHHPLTMARMDRLYGVTMQERGVSRLLSVDLQRAAAMAEAPRMAAE